MRLFTKRNAMIATAAFSGLMMLGVEQASATLFEHLFGSPRIRKVEEAPPEPKKIVIPKVSSPQYYNYKVDRLVKVDFGALISAVRNVIPSSDEAAADQIIVAAVSEPGETPAITMPGIVQSVSPDAFVEAIGELSEFELLAEDDIAAALVAHYSAHPDFLWVRDGAFNHRGEEALAVLADAETHGLPANEYALPKPDAAAAIAPLTSLVRQEMALSAKVLRYVRDAHRGRVNPNRISGYHDFPEKPLDYAHVLEVLHDTFAVRTYLESWHPQNSAYAALRAELAELRASRENTIVVAPDTFVRPGGSTPEFANLLKIIDRDADAAMRDEFGPLLIANTGTQTYTENLIPLIKAAQEKAGVKGDGIIGPRTVAAIAGDSKADRLDKVLVAMERLRWLPSDLGPRHVFINVAEFKARYIEGGVEKLAMRTVVGRKSNQTSFFYDEIEYVEFHPYWGVPRSIIVNEMLPRLLNDPGYLDRAGYEVTDSRGRRVSSSSINWAAQASHITYDIRQTPGEANALGELKILFPNKHAIYMHDTPSKSLFDRESRAFSHGCVRLKDPRGMAAAVLGWDRARVDERLKGGHGQEDLPVRFPVYVGYFTAWPDASGTIIYSPDVYDRDSHVLKAMEKIDDVRIPSV